MNRAGPNRHSLHEFATHSELRRIHSQTRSMRATKRNTANPAATSTSACIPVVRQLTAAKVAQPHQIQRNRGRPAARAAAAMNAPAQTESWLGNYLAGRQAVNNRDRVNAAIFFEKALKSDPENRMLLEQTFAYSISAGRIDTARSLADRILVLHHGSLHEQGTHDELMAKRGMYHTLYQMQFLAEERA